MSVINTAAKSEVLEVVGRVEHETFSPETAGDGRQEVNVRIRKTTVGSGRVQENSAAKYQNSDSTKPNQPVTV